MLAQRLLVLFVALAAACGFTFAAVSTSDFTAHLDRSVHDLHCSFLPGAEVVVGDASAGCHVTLMSPYSSVLRDTVWGGIPISLPGMAVFAYLVFLAVALLVTRRDGDPRATAFLAAANALPFFTSLGMGWIAFHELGAACKLCIGIYASSTVGLVLAIAAWLRARRAFLAAPAQAARQALDEARRAGARRGRDLPLDASVSLGDTARADETLPEDVRPFLDTAVATASADATDAGAPEGAPQPRLASASELDRRLATERGPAAPATPSPIGPRVLAAAFALGVLAVLAPTLAYAAGAPDFSRFIGTCGTLSHPDGGDEVLVPIGPQGGAIDMIEVLDPLCASCRAFEARFGAHEAASAVRRRALLFPLDDRCNWMVDEALHPGACTVSEAVLCAADGEGGASADAVLAWAFAHQDEIHAAATRSEGDLERLISASFPAVTRCLGTPAVRARLNRALRWAVSNELPVLTPQAYVGGSRLCDADTDLGLDYALTRLIERASGGGAR